MLPFIILFSGEVDKSFHWYVLRDQPPFIVDVKSPSMSVDIPDDLYVTLPLADKRRKCFVNG